MKRFTRIACAALGALLLVACGSREPSTRGGPPTLRLLTESQYRNVIADVRFLFWMLDVVHDAGPILEELGVAGLRGKTIAAAAPAPAPEAAPAPATPESAAPASTQADVPPGGGCGCDLTDGPRSRGEALGFTLLCLGVGVGLRRRRPRRANAHARS